MTLTHGKKHALSAIALILTATINSQAYARSIFPSDVLGINLFVPGIGQIGHVALATRDMVNAGGMKYPATFVIEALNAAPVCQINTFTNFLTRCPTYWGSYWGSKYGIAEKNKGFALLVEANQQRWWCPQYTNDAYYLVGQGIPNSGGIIRCGIWRSDTYVWWAYKSQGYDIMPFPIWSPVALFNFLPFFNPALPPTLGKLPQQSNTLTNTSLDKVTAEELNEMSYEAFQGVMDAPPAHYVSSLSAIHLQFAYDPSLNDVKRGIMIDRLIAENTEADLVKKLINLYLETVSLEVKSKIVQGLMLYNQNHDDAPEQALLKNFFNDLLNGKALYAKMADKVLRGFIDSHSAEEILANEENIHKWLSVTDHYSSIMLKYALVLKSKELQVRYIPSMVSELREANNADLDSYLFGPLSLLDRRRLNDLLEPESRQLIVEYLKVVGYKYTPHGIRADILDIHRGTTAPFYHQLMKKLDIVEVPRLDRGI